MESVYKPGGNRQSTKDGQNHGPANVSWSIKMAAVRILVVAVNHRLEGKRRPCKCLDLHSTKS